jgi:hypothetical protein
MDEQGRFDSPGGVAEAIEDFGPALDAVGIGWMEDGTEVAELGGYGGAIVLAGKKVAAGSDVRQSPGVRGIKTHAGFHVLANDLRVGRTDEQTMTEKHVFDGLEVTFRNPAAFRVLVHDKETAVNIEAPEQKDGVMGIAVIHCGDPRNHRSRIEAND